MTKPNETADAGPASVSTDLLERVLPCPFCGSELIGIRYEGQPARRYAFQCGGCGGTTGAVDVCGTATGSQVFFTNPRALAKWNTRSNAEVSRPREAATETLPPAPRSA